MRSRQTEGAPGAENAGGNGADSGEKDAKGRTVGKATAATTTVSTATVNLVKNLIGAGIFSLPTGLLRGKVVPGISIMLFAGAAQGGSFVLIAYLCQRLGCSSYRGVFSAAFGRRAGDLVDICIMTNSFFACVAYNILVADFLQKALEGLFGWAGVSRSLLIWANTLAITLPLSHARNLSPLRYTSMLGVAIIAFVFLYVTHDFLHSFPEAGDNLAKHASGAGIGLFTTLALSTGAFQAHYNAPRFYRELGCDLAAHTRTVAMSFGTTFLIYSIFATSGLGLFGDELQGNVLKNYPATGNVCVLLAWLGMAFAVVFTYPLVFTTGRDSLITMVPALQRASTSSPQATHVALTTGPVCLIAVVACAFEDVSVITGLLGATIGACLCWIFPAVSYLRVTARNAPAALREAQAPLLPGRAPPPARAALPAHGPLRTWAWCMVVVGFSSMAVGVGKSVGLI